MQVLVFFDSLLFAFTIMLAALILYRNPGNNISRPFVSFSLLTAVWCFGFIFMVSAPDEKAARAWFRIMAAGWSFFVPLFLHIILELTRNKLFKKHRWLAWLIYLPAPVFMYKTVFDMQVIAGFRRIPAGWIYFENNSSAWSIINQVYMAAYIAAIIIVLYRWIKKSRNPVHNKQGWIIIITVIASFVLFWAIIYLPFDFLKLFDLLPVACWEIGLAYAIAKYNFIIISPATAAAGILNTMADGLLLVNQDGVIININPALMQILREKRNIIGKSMEKVFPGIFAESDLLNNLTLENSIHDLEVIYTNQTSEKIYLSLSASLVQDKFGQKTGFILLLRDISERKQIEKQLQYLATHDVLTDLPNRVVLNDRLKNSILKAKRYQQMVALIIIDVDHFKHINDTYGHDAGDMALKEVAEKLKKKIRGYDTLTRMGGDEFVIVLSDLKDIQSCEIVVKRICNAFPEPLCWGNYGIVITLSLGVSVYPGHAENIDDLYKFADLALYRVKNSGRNNYQFYSAEIDAEVRRIIKLEQELKTAVNNNEFELQYQPIYETITGKLFAMEALLHWKHPEQGIIGALDFIPLAEKSDLIITIGEWVIRTVCRQQKAWKDKNCPLVPVTINLSAKQFLDVNLVNKIEADLNESGIEPSQVQLEFTESTAMIEVGKTIKIVEQLNAKGILILIDDFGSGYSSMSWLKYLKVSTIKIDKFFIQNIAQDTNDAAIVKAIISMAHAMNIKVVAEGVETDAQFNTLSSMYWEKTTEITCDCVQGYLFSKPVSAENAGNILVKNCL